MARWGPGGEVPPPKLKRGADAGDEADANDESDAATPRPMEDDSIESAFRVISTTSEFRETTRITKQS